MGRALALALVTALVTIGVATLGSYISGQAGLAERVDRNTAELLDGTEAVICILRLGATPGALPRTDANIAVCIEEFQPALEVPDGGTP